jgi:hypothetical protein
MQKLTSYATGVVTANPITEHCAGSWVGGAVAGKLVYRPWSLVVRVEQSVPRPVAVVGRDHGAM